MYKGKQSKDALANLKAKYGVKLINREVVISDADLKKFYESHKDAYMTPETYDVYHIESKNKDLLTKKINSLKDIEAFKKLAAKVNENSWTKAEQGYIGIIKRDHSLPDGIGMLPALFTDLDTMKSGLVKTPYQNPDTKKWHLFWLVQKSPRQSKPMDRVLITLKQDYKSETVQKVNPNDTLATFSKNNIVQQKNVDFLRQEIPPNMQERYTNEALVDYILTWDLTTLDAETMGLTNEVKLQAQREESKVGYWSQIFQDSIVAKTAGLDSATLKKTFETNHSFFSSDSGEKDYHKYVRDIAAFLAIEPKEMDIEFKTNPERYRRDTTALTFEQARYDIFQSLKGAAMTKADEKLLDNLKREFQVVILDPTLLPAKISDPKESYKQAQNMHYDRKLDPAIELYQRLRNEFPKNESLQDSICFGLAQIYIEQEKYQQALAEYRRLTYLYPKSGNNYKAMFMVGFIHAEHLKNDSAAVRAFEIMLNQYPKSDLSDDADWMIRNIRSGGKLMPVLEGDSGYVAPADSSKKEADATVAPAAPSAPAPKK